MVNKWIESDCLEYVTPNTRLEVLGEVLSCLNTAYEIHYQNDEIATNLSTKLIEKLDQFLNLLQDNTHRKTVQEIIASFLVDTCASMKLPWPGGRFSILQEIFSLPWNVLEWDETESDVVFLLAHLQLVHSK